MGKKKSLTPLIFEFENDDEKYRCYGFALKEESEAHVGNNQNYIKSVNKIVKLHGMFLYLPSIILLLLSMFSVAIMIRPGLQIFIRWVAPWIPCRGTK